MILSGLVRKLLIVPTCLKTYLTTTDTKHHWNFEKYVVCDECIKIWLHCSAYKR